jgi:cytochrome c553
MAILCFSTVEIMANLLLPSIFNSLAFFFILQSGDVFSAEKLPTRTAEHIVEQTCSACHGKDGNTDVSNFPRLAGQIAEYTAKQLHDYKYGGRPNPVMTPIAMSLNAQEREALSQYFEKQTLIPAYSNRPQKTLLGQKIFRGGVKERNVPACMSCHGPEGKGLKPLYPRIWGQNQGYVIEQFRILQMIDDPNLIMDDIAARLKKEEIESLAEFLAALRPTSSLVTNHNVQ